MVYLLRRSYQGDGALRIRIRSEIHLKGRFGRSRGVVNARIGVGSRDPQRFLLMAFLTKSNFSDSNSGIGHLHPSFSFWPTCSYTQILHSHFQDKATSPLSLSQVASCLSQLSTSTHGPHTIPQNFKSCLVLL